MAQGLAGCDSPLTPLGEQIAQQKMRAEKEYYNSTKNPAPLSRKQQVLIEVDRKIADLSRELARAIDAKEKLQQMSDREMERAALVARFNYL
jgi:hypothetical protein